MIHYSGRQYWQYSDNPEQNYTFYIRQSCLHEFLEAQPPETVKRLTSLGITERATSTAIIPLMAAVKSKTHRASNISIQVTGGLLYNHQKHLKSRELAENTDIVPRWRQP